MEVLVEDSLVFDDLVPVASDEDVSVEDFPVEDPPVEDSFDKGLSEERAFVVESSVDDPVEDCFFEDVVGDKSEFEDVSVHVLVRAAFVGDALVSEPFVGDTPTSLALVDTLVGLAIVTDFVAFVLVFLLVFSLAGAAPPPDSDPGLPNGRQMVGK